MAKEVRLPQLGQTMEEGTIVNCLVEVGKEIAKGDIVFEVETDKATLEMESPAAGFVKAITVNVGDTIPVNELILILGDENEEVEVPSSGSTAVQEATPAPVASAAPVAASAPASGGTAQLPAGANVVNLPQLGQTMEEGTIVNCLAEAGKEVSKGDIVFEVETDKATLEMECPAAGVVGAVLVEVGETVPVNVPVLIITEAGVEITDAMIASVKGGEVAAAAPVEQAKAEPVVEVAPVAAPVEVKAEPVVEAKVEQPVSGGRVFASPRAKKTAKALGVDINSVKGTGPGGRIVEADVKAAASGGGAAVAASTASAKVELGEPKYKLGETIKVSRIHKITGQRMLQSKQTIPCFYLNTVVDMTDVFALRSKVNKTSDVKIAFNDYMIRAIGLGLKHFPMMAGQLAGDSVKIADNINVGLAIAMGDDLAAPVVKDVDKKTVAEVAKSSKAIIARAKDGKLAPDDLAGGVCTLSNLGAFGIDSFIPIVIPGQCSIIGVGAIKDVLVPSSGSILLRKQMNMTISVDHTVANGAYAAQFLDTVKKLLESPASL